MGYRFTGEKNLHLLGLLEIFLRCWGRVAAFLHLATSPSLPLVSWNGRE